VAARQDLLDGLEGSKATPNVKLLHLLAGLNPAQPPIYRQAHIDAAMLRSLARAALDGDPGARQTRKAREILDELWDDRLLQVLSRFAAAGELAPIDDRWQGRIAAWERAVAELIRRQPGLTGVLAEPDTAARARAAMLEIAAGADRGPDWIRALNARGAALPAPIPWYADMLGWVRGDPVRAFAAWCASGVAQAQAEQLVREQQAAQQAERRRHQAWQEHESHRLNGRPSAMGMALGGVAMTALVWALVSVLAAKSVALLWAIVAVILVQLVTELGLAHTLGRDYHPRFSLRQAMGEFAGHLGPWIQGNVGLAVFLIAGLIALLIFVWMALPIMAVIAAAVQAVWTAVRYQQWLELHQRKHREAMSR
jgi:hypothetical protein